MLRKAFSNKVTFERREKRIYGASHRAVWKIIPGRGNNHCKGTEATTCRMNWRNSKETSVSGAWWLIGENKCVRWGHRGGGRWRYRSCRTLSVMVNTGFCPDWDGKTLKDVVQNTGLIKEWFKKIGVGIDQYREGKLRKGMTGGF